MTQTPETTSLVRWSAPSDDRAAIVCIPWAGAGAAPFRSWGEALEDDAVIYGARLPGREIRLAEPHKRTVSAIVDELSSDVGRLPHERIALFGHCSGALIAFELAHALRSTRTCDPTHLLVASQLPPRMVAATDARDLEIEERMIRRDLVETFAADPELLDLMLASVAADMHAVATYRYEAAERLSLPITVFVGSEDEYMRVADAAGWRDETAGPVTFREVAGADHLFRATAWHTLAEAVRSALAPDDGSATRGRETRSTS
jgi:surfactin synthase thioesterase subunit